MFNVVQDPDLIENNSSYLKDWIKETNTDSNTL